MDRYRYTIYKYFQDKADLADASFLEKCYGPKDRRKLHSLIINAGRCGIKDCRIKQGVEPNND